MPIFEINKNKKMKKYIFIVLVVIFNGITFGQNNSEIKSFMDELFFNLPTSANKLEIVKAINSNEALGKAEVNLIHTTVDIRDNEYLKINNNQQLQVYFGDEDKFVSGFKIVMMNEIGEDNAHTITNLLEFFEIRKLYKKEDDSFLKKDIYIFFTKTNNRAFCIVEVWSESRVLNPKKSCRILISYNPRYL